MEIGNQPPVRQITMPEIQTAGTTQPSAGGFNTDLERMQNVSSTGDHLATSGAQPHAVGSEDGVRARNAFLKQLGLRPVGVSTTGDANASSSPGVVRPEPYRFVFEGHIIEAGPEQDVETIKKILGLLNVPPEDRTLYWEALLSNCNESEYYVYVRWSKSGFVSRAGLDEGRVEKSIESAAERLGISQDQDVLWTI
ncbi:hypothetical protein [Pandoraea sp. NPDC090278]|uniref:hypothetical protein n=1 Tax=Pandoraea sp. NPDC090278 TaxID=3364391 RepID=UPI00383B5DC5